MIRETTEVELTPGLIRSRIASYSGQKSAKISDEAVKLLEIFLLAEDVVREEFLKSISAFVCDQCGAPSCLHGYSDE